MTQAEYDAFLFRKSAKEIHSASSDGVEREADLHEQIIDYCKNASPRPWVPFHGAMCSPTKRVEGEPDFLIFAPWGCLLVECKSRTGKLSVEQAALKHHLEALNHHVYIVRSMREFIDAVEQESTLQKLWAKGREAWNDVPSATAFVEELRGNTKGN
jgi:hypothetical protein